MGKLVVFNQITLDGYFASVNGDIGWMKSAHDAEQDEFAAQNAKAGGTLLFGRKTYELMASYWLSSDAARNDPDVARQMNNLPKVVFSRTLNKADWNNTRLVKDNLRETVQKMKLETGEGLAILGSGSIVSQLAPLGLIDEYQFMVYPIVLGKGRTMFEGVKDRINLKLTNTRTFGNGNVLLCYEPVR